MTQIVGIGGKLASGKDAIADRLVDEHGWMKFGMSDALADATYTLNPWIRLDTYLGWRNRFTASVARLFRRSPKPVFVKYQWLVDAYGYVHAKEESEVRNFLQKFGTEVGRKMLSDGDLWTEIMKRKIKAAAATGVPGIIVTGVRFPNELALFEDLDAETWWVNRPALKSTVNATHASENSVSAVDFDRVIVNDGTLSDLYHKVDDLVT